MPAKTNLLKLDLVRSRVDLVNALAPLILSGHITSNQIFAIATVAAPLLPAPVEFQQRTPKGVVYGRVGAARFQVNNRAKIRQQFD